MCRTRATEGLRAHVGAKDRQQGDPRGAAVRARPDLLVHRLEQTLSTAASSGGARGWSQLPQPLAQEQRPGGASHVLRLRLSAGGGGSAVATSAAASAAAGSREQGAQTARGQGQQPPGQRRGHARPHLARSRLPVEQERRQRGSGVGGGQQAAAAAQRPQEDFR